MKTSTTFFATLLVLALGAASPAFATMETCGDTDDDDNDGEADEGCYPNLYLGVCESPLPCDTAGAPEPNGGVRLPRPPDFDVKVPFGPSLTFARFYSSHYEPNISGNNGTYMNPLGRGFQHNFMSWIKDPSSSNTPSWVILHTREGLEVRFNYSHTASSLRYYVPQAGHHFVSLTEHTSTHNWVLKNMDGSSLKYEHHPSSGLWLLTHVVAPGGKQLVVAYNGNDQTYTVTAASGGRVLTFSYDGSDFLENVELSVSSTPVVSRDYDVTGSVLVSVKQGGTASAIETYTWESSPARLLTVESSGSTLLSYVWHQYGAHAGKLARIHTPTGVMGLMYDVDHDENSGTPAVTNHFFYLQDAPASCDDDDGCWGGACHLTTLTSTSSEGICFRARRHVTFSGDNDYVDYVPVTVTSPACSSCTDVEAYAWDSGTSQSNLQLVGTKSADDVWTTTDRDVDGLVTKLVEGDDDDDPASVPWNGRVTYFWYSDSDFPSLPTERRVKSALESGTCDANTTTACKRTLTTYGTFGVTSTEEIGFTLDENDDVVAFSYETEQEYDNDGRLTATRGPRAGVYDDVEYVYNGTSGYLEEVKRRLGSSTYLTTTFADYDHWGNAKLVTDPNAKATCKTFDAIFGLLATSRRVINGSHTSCASSGGNDETTSYTYDKARRLVELKKPIGNCTEWEYDADGRLSLIRNSDLCDTGGDTHEFTYDTDGHATREEWRQNGTTLMREREVEYWDDRRVFLEKNPVDSGLYKAWFYDDDGVASELQFEDYGSTGARTQWDVDERNRISAERRFTTSGSEDWSFTSGLQLDLPTQVSDAASHDIDLAWDDLGRKVKQVTPETGALLYVRDEAGNVVKRLEDYGGGDEVANTFSYDAQNRLTAEDYDDASCGGGQGAEIQYTYDALPGGVSCPSGVSCNLLAGRLAHVKTKLACDSGAGDKTFDQAAFYSYDNVGRIYQHTVKDDSGRTGTDSYSYDKNSNNLYLVHPSGDYSRHEYGSSTYYHSDVDRPHYLYRNTTMLMNNGYYIPWGPIYSQGLMMSFDHGGTMYQIGFSKYRDTAYRPTLRHVQSTYSTPDQVFKIDYGQDDRGRITKRDFSYGTGGQVDQFFKYDNLNRVTCRSRSAQSSCPTTGSELMENVGYNSSSERSSMILKNAALAAQTHSYSYVSGKPEQIDEIAIDTDGISGPEGTVSFAYDDRGNRLSDDDDRYTGAGDEKREYTYDARNNLITVSGQYFVAANDLNAFVMTNAYDERNRRVFKSFKDTVTNDEAQWIFYYDQWDRLIQAVHTPDVSDPDDYSIYDWFYVEGEPTAYYQLDYVNGSNTTTTRRFLFGDEQGRPHTAWSYPASGSSSRVWEVEAGTWGNDVPSNSVYQPLRFSGQYADSETAAVSSAGTILRWSLSDNRFRTFDSSTGTYLQVDDELTSTLAEYSYADENPVMNDDPDGRRRRVQNFEAIDCSDVRDVADDVPLIKYLVPITTRVSAECNAWKCDDPNSCGGASSHFLNRIGRTRPECAYWLEKERELCSEGSSWSFGWFDG